MPFQLPDDCLNEIFEYLEEDKIALHSCLLVNRHWCKISVRILWRNIWRLKYSAAYRYRYPYQSKSILSTLIACLPNESIVLLYKNGILISTPTSKPPLFNYVAFCKALSIGVIGGMIDIVIKQSVTTLSDLNGKKVLVAKEIIKMFMNQISSLKKLTCLPFCIHHYPDISFIHFPGASDCLAGLSELRCSSSKVYSGFFYQLSQVCHKLQTLSIKFFQDEISNGLEELISLQNNLNNLYLFVCESNWKKIIPALEKHANSLTKLHLYYLYNYDHSSDHNLPSFIALFSNNLQEIKLSFNDKTSFEDFKKLQNVTFPKLKVLKIPCQCPELEYIVKFLENNGKYLEDFHIGVDDNSLNLSIAKFCPNLKKLFVMATDDELDTLKIILDSCEYLESIEVWDKMDLSVKKIFEIVAKYSPENFCELKISYKFYKPSSEDFESFFISWKNRASKKLLILIITCRYYHNNLDEESIKVIEKYKSLGIIKKFESYYKKDEIMIEFIL